MSSLIAKRYVKALLKERSLTELLLINEQIKLISTAYGNHKFLNIINSIDVATQKKVDLLVSFIDDINIVVKNLLVLLGKNKRLSLVPNIAEELDSNYCTLINEYSGVVYSNTKLAPEFILDIKNKFENKFNVKLILINEVCKYDGIKVIIYGLGIEIGFEKDKFKSQMIEYILKAV